MENTTLKMPGLLKTNEHHDHRTQTLGMEEEDDAHGGNTTWRTSTVGQAFLKPATTSCKQNERKKNVAEVRPGVRKETKTTSRQQEEEKMIMVRIKGLGRALGHVTGRGVGRGDRDDSDDARQRQRPTTSAWRQRVAVIVAHDEPVVPAPDVEADVFPDGPMAPADVDDIVADIPADTGVEAAEDEHEGFPGGPCDPSERPELKLSSHGRKVHSLGRSVPAIEGLVVGTGLSPLITCSVDTGDRGLLSSFVERWHRETSSFHLPVGELTITLDNVSSLLHLPVVGDLHAFQPLHVDDAVQMLVDLLMVSAESARAEITQYRGSYVRLQWSATNVHVVYLEALCDLSMTERYAWGVAALVHMYDQLNDASISHSQQLGGYITLLQCWIYEYFPSVADSTTD
ncbi:protein MAIN-LIKE 1-like [Glycine max]|uniref:protein MAIN-LIKE 1-like n=1 Tax=Glycine max TaxID=3847 RepID=UPI0003DEBEE6|nr:protein MAIN-LIKE 1-like [Glycine max]|eukprot:XP_006606817.1 protein MAIN-LIKE 1-like [Glycine max]